MSIPKDLLAGSKNDKTRSPKSEFDDVSWRLYQQQFWLQRLEQLVFTALSTKDSADPKKFDDLSKDILGDDDSLPPEIRAKRDAVKALVTDPEQRKGLMGQNLTDTIENLTWGPGKKPPSATLLSPSMPTATLLSPQLLDMLAREAKHNPARIPPPADSHEWNKCEIALFIKEQAEAIGLDWKMSLNQCFQESGLRPDAVGPDTRYGRARGIGQFIPSTGKAYGLTEVSDFHDPRKSIIAHVSYMKDLTTMFKGNQRLGLIAYNAGPGNVKKFGPDITIEKWIDHMEAQRKELGPGAFADVRNQTYGYVKIIDSTQWASGTQQKAMEKMAGMSWLTGTPAGTPLSAPLNAPTGTGLSGTFEVARNHTNTAPTAASTLIGKVDITADNKPHEPRPTAG